MASFSFGTIEAMVDGFVIGVDEAGRGPLAGPVAVGVVCTSARFDIRKHFPTVNDSKRLSPRAREEIFEQALARQRAGEIQFTVRFAGSVYIDKFGITHATRSCVWSGVRSLADATDAKVFLDGLLKAPPEYEQETIIRGDALVPIISLASVLAKVRRDKLMEQMARRYPRWGFAEHKGYGTPAHLSAIRKHGLSPIHRRTFWFDKKA